MVHIPPEIKALIVDEIWHSRDPQPSLSALGLVWKDATPFIRAHRFNNVNVSRWKTLSRLLALKNDATRPFTLIRKLAVHSTESEAQTVILGAINVEALTYVPLYSLKSIASLATHTNLTALALSHGEHKFTTLMVLLRSIPRLTSLTLSRFRVFEFRDIASRVWPYVYDKEGWHEEAEHFFLEICAPMPWEKYKFPDSDPLPNISHLSLDTSRGEHLWFLDFVCSPKSPFRNLQRLDLFDETSSFMAVRVEAVLKKYGSSLVEFGLHAELNEYAEEDLLPVPLTLPAGIQHYTFFVNINVEDEGRLMHAKVVYDNINGARDTLKHVTMHIRYLRKSTQEVIDNNAELDRVLVSLDLQRFDVQVDIHSNAIGVERPDECARGHVARIFPLVTAKVLTGAGGGKIFWTCERKGLKGTCV